MPRAPSSASTGSTGLPRRRAPDYRSGAVEIAQAPDPDAPRQSLVDLDWFQDEEASVLLVGDGHPMQAALAAALVRHEVHVEITSGSAVLDAVVAATPKLVLLLGQAAKNGGAEVLARLRRVELAAAVPVVVLVEEKSLEARISALRNGATSVIAHSASVDAIAERVATLARAGDESEIQAAAVGETTLLDVLDVLGKKIIEGLLTGEDPRRVDFGRVRLVLGPGQQLIELFDEFSSKFGSTVKDAEHIDYQLSASDTTAELLGEAALAEARSTADIAGLRVLLADADSMRADSVARALRRHGADVVVTGLSPTEEGLNRLRQFDAMVLLIRSDDLAAGGRGLVGRMKRDPRLRWVSMMVADWDEELLRDDGARAIEGLLGQLAAMGDPERGLVARAEAGPAFDTRLEVMGAARSLRALASCSHPVRMTIHNPRVTAKIDLSNGLLVGATAEVLEEPRRTLEGAEALSAVLMLQSGRVQIEPIAEASVLNLMSTVETALDMTDTETPPIPLSQPPPALAGSSRELSLEQLARSSAELEEPPAFRRSKFFGLSFSTLAMIAGAAIALVAAALFVTLAPETEERIAPVPEASAVAPPPEPASAPEATGSPGEPLRAEPPPKPGVPGGALLERVARGDSEAIEELEGRPPSERSVEETLALGAGRVALGRAEIQRLRDRIADNPSLLEDEETVARLVEWARNPSLAPVALAAIASLPGPTSADVIYHVWVGTPQRTEATQLAEELVKADAVREKASPALQVALDLREAEECEDVEAVLPRAEEHGDRRSLHLLARLNKRRGCGPTKAEDCYKCLRKSKDLARAIRAVRERRGPKL